MALAIYFYFYFDLRQQNLTKKSVNQLFKNKWPKTGLNPAELVDQTGAKTACLQAIA